MSFSNAKKQNFNQWCLLHNHRYGQLGKYLLYRFQWLFLYELRYYVVWPSRIRIFKNFMSFFHSSLRCRSRCSAGTLLFRWYFITVEGGGNNVFWNTPSSVFLFSLSLDRTTCIIYIYMFIRLIVTQTKGLFIFRVEPSRGNMMRERGKATLTKVHDHKSCVNCSLKCLRAGQKRSEPTSFS